MKYEIGLSIFVYVYIKLFADINEGMCIDLVNRSSYCELWKA